MTFVWQLVVTITCVIAALLPRSTGAFDGPVPPVIVKQRLACTTGERWQIEPIAHPAWSDWLSWQDLFGASVRGKLIPVRAFSEALALRRRARTPLPRVFSEYWISRALLDGKLPHIARAGFASVASQPLPAEFAALRLAALECLNVIQRRYPSLPLPDSVASQLPRLLTLASTEAERETAREAIGSRLRQAISDGALADERKQLAALLGAESGAHGDLARGLLAASEERHEDATEHLEKFLARPEPVSPPSLVRLNALRDHARLLASRAYYAQERFAQSIRHLQSIRKNSNELARSLPELAWSFLLAGKHREAIGTGMNLQEGVLRRVFAPEAPMVMAMAMNELCQYPDALRAIETFRKHYEPSYRWLERWNQQPRPLYDMAVSFVRKQDHELPAAVAGEWLRSPIFIATQEEINLLFDERDATTSLGRAGSREQNRMSSDIRTQGAELLTRVREMKKKRLILPGRPLPEEIVSELGEIKRRITHFKRLRAAAPLWRSILAKHQKTAPRLERLLVERVNHDLARRTRRMLALLDEVAENNQLIEIEIYNGASQDIIWQNAHPDYREVARGLAQERPTNEGEVWVWGGATAEGGEVWEDELGSFRAELFDNCSSKEKYLSVKKRRRS